MSVEAALSEVSTTRVSVEQLLEQRILGPYADVVITDSESALGSIDSAFGSIQPPTKAADEIRDATTQVLTQAEDAVATARVSARRGDQAGLEQALRDLRQAERDLGAAEAQLQ